MQYGLHNLVTSLYAMPKGLEDLRERFGQDNQDTKRGIGEYLYNQPAQWVSRQELVDEFDIDESGVSRHIDDLHEEGFLTSKYVDDKRHVQWEGRGAGGIEYWIREAVPPQLWAAGSELRPLLTLDSLGGAYIPTLLFAFLVIVGFLTAIVGVAVSHLPSNSIFGMTATDLVIWTGIVTMMASVSLLLLPIAKLLDVGLKKVLKQTSKLNEGEENETN
ncbi:helix-turn-helix domain-containing protein [Haloplanus rubicundus]|uniref:hypothetical protein n=1 Tax=Haloplanus rubicundus TaxID=1547898 RepID=UPI0013001960|nr:hypothetical protein [Haloplanus rubicundus]